MANAQEEAGACIDSSVTVAGGVEDCYGEDRATEEQLVTPWIVSVARSDTIVFHLSFPIAQPNMTFFFFEISGI